MQNVKPMYKKYVTDRHMSPEVIYQMNLSEMSDRFLQHASEPLKVAQKDVVSYRRRPAFV